MHVLILLYRVILIELKKKQIAVVIGDLVSYRDDERNVMVLTVIDI